MHLLRPWDKSLLEHIHTRTKKRKHSHYCSLSLYILCCSHGHTLLFLSLWCTELTPSEWIVTASSTFSSRTRTTSCLLCTQIQIRIHRYCMLLNPRWAKSVRNRVCKITLITYSQHQFYHPYQQCHSSPTSPPFSPLHSSPTSPSSPLSVSNQLKRTSCPLLYSLRFIGLPHLRHNRHL